MAETKIEWADYTFNPWWGCQRVSPGCEHCYAETFDKRIGGNHWGPPEHTSRRFFGDSYWQNPIKWNAAAQAQGVRKRVFCASMADVFEAGPVPDVSKVDHARDRLWGLVEQTPQLIWMLLTKRPENIKRMAPEDWVHGSGFPNNVWVGTTVESQVYAVQRIPELLQVPVAVRFLSVEPMLGPLDLSPWMYAGFPAHITADGRAMGGRQNLHWVIVGGESGHRARPMHPEWARLLLNQCQTAGVPFFFKQWGEWRPQDLATPLSGRNSMRCLVGDGSEGEMIYRVGNHRAGRELDGHTWNEVPA